MHRRLEKSPTGSTTQLQGEEGLNVFKEQRTPAPYTEQRSSKRDLTREHTSQDLPSRLNEAERQQKAARDTEAVRQDLATYTLKIETIDKEYADLPLGEKVQAQAQSSELSDHIIHENQIEAEQKETRFQKVRQEIEQAHQALSETNQHIETLEKYQQDLEQETQASPHTLTTTHTLKNQIELLDTAIASLQEECNSKQGSSQEEMQQKIKDFSAQKQDYQDKKAIYAREEMHLPRIEKALAETQQGIKQRENKLSELNTQLKEIKEKRASVQKEYTAPLQVTQNFATQFTMAQDHLHYLEQEIATKNRHNQTPI